MFLDKTNYFQKLEENFFEDKIFKQKYFIVMRTQNWIHQTKLNRTGPQTARKYVSVLEPDPELPDCLSQF